MYFLAALYCQRESIVDGKTALPKKIIIALLVAMVPQQLMLFLTRNRENPWSFTFISFAAFCLCFLVMKITGRPENLSARATGFSLAFAKGWYILTAGLIFAVLNFLSIDFTHSPSFQKTAAFFIETIFVALFEEMLFRGIIQNYITEDYEKRQKNIWGGLCLAAGIFASVHFLNLAGRPYFILGTFTQVVYTFCLGLLTGTVYWASKNLWTAVILHFTFNIMGGYIKLFYADIPVNKGDINLLSAAIQLAIMLPSIPIAYRIYKKAGKKNRKEE